MGHYKQNSYSGSLDLRHYRSGVSNSTHTTMCSKQNHQKQTMTIIWHVDNLQISHVEKYVLVFILSKFNEKFWKSKPTDDKMGKSPRIPRHNNRLQAEKEMIQWVRYYGGGISQWYKDYMYQPQQSTRQQEYYSMGRKKQKFQLKDNMTPKHTIFLHERQNKKK